MEVGYELTPEELRKGMIKRLRDYRLHTEGKEYQEISDLIDELESRKEPQV